MLHKFTVNNFKSLINVTYEPGAVSLLVGANNSGKTNLCQAIYFLSRTARSRKTLPGIWYDMMGGETAANNVYFNHATIDLTCTCDLIVDDETLTFHYTLDLAFPQPRGIPMTIVTERLHVSGGVFGLDTATLLENKVGSIRLLNEELYRQGKPSDACYQESTAKPDATMLSLLHDTRANRLAIAFRDYLASWQYYDLESGRLRCDHFDPHPRSDVLGADGANLASVLFHLKSNEERRYRQVLELVRKIEPRLDALNFTIAGERIVMELTDDKDNRFGLSSASNGTLRFMALCYILLNNARQINSPLTIIEEPENGIYVRCLKPLLELIDPAGAVGQYVFTSHSPYFIDLFDTHLENIILMQDRETYSALVKPDPGQVRKYLEEMPLGELHFREMLT